MIDLFVRASFRAPGGHFTEKSGCGALFVSARLHHLTLAPASQGPFGFGYTTKLLVFSLKHENLSEDSTARHVVAPFTLAFVLPWLSHVRARRTWAPQRRGRAAGQLHGGTRHSYNHYGWRARGP